MKQPQLEKLSKEQLIEMLMGASELQVQLSLTCGVLANDLRLINEGETEGIRILNGDEKYFDRIMVMVKNRTDLSSLSLLPELPETTPTKSSTKKLNLKPGDNPYEHIVKQVRNGHSKD